MTRCRDLPPELWEVIIHYLAPSDAWKLRSVNRVFYSCATAVDLEHVQFVKFKQKRVKGILERLCKTPSLGRFVHIFQISTNIDAKAAPLSFKAAFSHRPGGRQNYLIKKMMKVADLTNVQVLAIHYDDTVCSYMAQVWLRFATHIVHLELQLCSSRAAVHLGSLDPSVTCPNLKTFSLAYDDEGDFFPSLFIPTYRTHSLTLGKFPSDLECVRLFKTLARIIPSGLENLGLHGEHFQYLPSSALIHPHAFLKLKRLHISLLSRFLAESPTPTPELTFVPFIEARAENLESLVIEKIVDLQKFFPRLKMDNLRELCMCTNVFFESMDEWLDLIPKLTLLRQLKILSPSDIAVLGEVEILRIIEGLSRAGGTLEELSVTAQVVTIELLSALLSFLPNLVRLDLEQAESKVDEGIWSLSKGRKYNLRFVGLATEAAKVNLGCQGEWRTNAREKVRARVIVEVFTKCRVSDEMHQ